MNLDSLLSPISPDSPCGEDMTFSAEFDELQELRRQDDPSISQGEWVTELKVADWSGVIALSEKVLQTRSRDLRVVGWWAEAKAHKEGYGGLADGVSIAAGLCEQLWEPLHPIPEDGDWELRIGSLSWLLAQVVSLSHTIPVLFGAKRQISLQDIEAARAYQQSLERSPEARPPADESQITLDLVARAQKETPKPRFQAAREGLARLAQELVRLQAVVDGHLGVDGPAFTPAKEAVDRAKHALDRMAREMGLDAPDAASQPGDDTVVSDAADPSGQTPGAVAVAGVITSRKQALAQLRLVADYFRRTEPHSPVAYLADKAAKWGDMPLHDWLRAVMKDQGTLAQLEDLLGVEPPPSNPGY
jgi:type VI secretion system protein ImpA